MTTSVPIRIIVVEDWRPDAELIERSLRADGLDIVTTQVQDEPSFSDALDHFEPDVVLADFNLPRFDGMTAVKIARDRRPTLPVIIVTGSLTDEMAVECMKAGAADYVLKQRLVRLGPAVRRALERTVERRQREIAEQAIRYREAILEAVAEVGSIFLRSGDWRSVAQQALEKLGTATRASRVYVFENEMTPSGRLVTSQRFEWCGEGITPQMDNPLLQDADYASLGMDRWRRAFEVGDAVIGTVSGFPGAEREILEPQDIHSLAVFPVYAGGQWWGMIGFDQCDEGFEWAPTELEALRVAADTLGAALHQEHANAALTASAEQLRSLASRITQVREEERSVIARELHDQLGQSLTGLKMDLAWLKTSQENGGAPTGPTIDSMGELIDQTIDTVRELSARLRPPILDDLGLAAALEWEVRRFADRTGTLATTDMSGLQRNVTDAESIALFRVLQEALTNVVRHADASSLSVTLTDRGGGVELIVEDDGRGIDDTSITDGGSLGIVGMRERLGAIGGQLRFAWPAEGGTRLIARIPGGARA